MAKNSFKIIVLSILTVAATLTSCNRKTVYDHYMHTPIVGWEKNDTLSFYVSPMTESTTYTEELGLRVNGAYPFMDLCLVVEQRIIPSNIVLRDTVNCKLADDNGQMKGHGISFYQYNIPITELQLSEGDSIEVFIRHNMKREILPGISDVGIKLSKK